jgi:hypothetical protein
MAKDDKIVLSPKHGVNPSIMRCFYCGEEFGVALPGLLEGDVEAPRSAIWSMEPCTECETLMKSGIILLGIDSSKSDTNKGVGGFYRTGHYVVTTEEYFKKNITGDDIVGFALKHRWCFVEGSLLDHLCSMKPERRAS